MKPTKEIEGSSIFDELLNETPLEDKIFVSKSLDIAQQIITTIENKNMLQKDLALKLNKSEAEISKWLSGFHNFTLKTLSKIESVLGEEVITTPKNVHENMAHYVKGFISVRNQSCSNVPTHFSNLLEVRNVRVAGNGVKARKLPRWNFKNASFKNQITRPIPTYS